MYSLYTDGGSRGNPGPSAIGIVIYKNDKVVFTFSHYIGKTTNNIAEYKALLAGIKLSKELGITEINIFMDSELIVKQIKGEYRVKDIKLYEIYSEVKNELDNIRYTITHITREYNHVADSLVNKELNANIKKRN